MEIRIGRNVDGTLDIIVPPKYSKVSNSHAKLIYENSVLKIVDLESSNGSYVNSKKIASKILNNDDVVLLGSNNPSEAYSLDVKSIIDDFNKIIFSEKTDFSKEFKKLKSVYNNYHSELSKVKRKLQLKNQLPKIMVSVFIGAILLISIVLNLIPQEFQKYQYPVMLIVMAIAGVISFSSKPINILDAQTEVELKYQAHYSCPKCKKRYNLNTHWKKLENAGSCSHGCGASFIINTN